MNITIRFFFQLFIIFFLSSSALAAGVTIDPSSAGTRTIESSVRKKTEIIWYDIVADGSGVASGTVILGAGWFRGVRIEPDESNPPSPGGTLVINLGAGSLVRDMLGGTGAAKISATTDVFLPAYDGSVFKLDAISSTDTVTVSLTGLGAANQLRLGFEIER